MKTNDDNVLALVQNNPESGILGLVNCVRAEPGNGRRIRSVFIESTAPSFNAEDQFYKEQLLKGFVMNVYKDGRWGTYRHLLLGDAEESECEHCFVNVMTKGDLSSLRWIEEPIKPRKDVGYDKILVHVSFEFIRCQSIK